MASERMVTRLKVARLLLSTKHHNMAISGALPDELREIEEDLDQIHSWLKQCKSTIDEEYVMRNLECRKLSYSGLKKRSLFY